MISLEFRRFRFTWVIFALLLPACTAFATRLAWDPSPSGQAVGYLVYSGPSSGTYTATVDVGAATSYIANLAPGQTRYFAVTAYDSGGIQSPYSNEIQATEPTGGPVAGLSASTTSGPAPLALNFTSTSTGSITSYTWTFGDGTSSAIQNPSKLYASPGVYTVSLQVSGPGGTNTQTKTNYITVSGPGDTVPPSVPGSAVGNAISTNAIAVSWLPSTDNVGVAEYQVERCLDSACVSWALIAKLTATAYTDGGLASATAYRYRIRAADAAGNLSSYSVPAVAKTLVGTDASPPSAPGRPVALPGPYSVKLRWAAAADNVGVTRYQLERCVGAGCTTFAQIASSASTSVTDTGRYPGTTYRYRVRAVDAAGNLSAYSPIVTTATTSASAATGFDPLNYSRVSAKSTLEESDASER